mgnify:CR=1 FL=1
MNMNFVYPLVRTHKTTLNDDERVGLFTTSSKSSIWGSQTDPQVVRRNGMASKTVDQKPVQTLNPYQWIRLIMTYLLIPLVLWVCGWDFGCLLYTSDAADE